MGEGRSGTNRGRHAGRVQTLSVLGIQETGLGAAKKSAAPGRGLGVRI